MSRQLRGFLNSLEPIDPDKIDRTQSDRAPDPVGQRMKRMELSERNTGKLIIRVAPEDCVVWAGNGRTAAGLNVDNCADLIESIRAEDGNRIPAIVRYRKDAPARAPRFELLVGTRRLFAVAHLRANGHPNLQLLAQVEEIDDEAAFRLQDLENRSRTDISEIERARSYRAAIDRYYGGVALRMAERLGLSSGYLTKLLAIARLPADVIAAFGGDANVPVGAGYAVSALLDDPKRRDPVLRRAKELAEEQAQRRAAGVSLLAAAAVAKALADAAAPPAAPRVKPVRPVVNAAGGLPLFKIVADRKDGLTVTIVADEKADDEELARALLDVVRASRLRVTRSRRK